MFGRMLAACGFLLIFGAITFASYCVGKYVIAGKVLQPSQKPVVHLAGETPTPSPPAPEATLSPPDTSPAARRLTQALRPKPRPDVVIEIKPKEQPLVRPEPDEPRRPSFFTERPPSKPTPPPPPRTEPQREARRTAEEDGDAAPRAEAPRPAESSKPKPRREERTPDNAREETRDRSKPEPSPTPPQPEPRKTPPATPKPQPASPTPKSDSGGSLHQVQVGAFESEDNARHLAAELHKKGYHAFVVKEGKDGKVAHKVYAGAFKEKQSADRLKGELEQQGYEAMVR